MPSHCWEQIQAAAFNSRESQSGSRMGRERITAEDFEQDYQALREYYLMPVIVKEAELAMGMRLRAQTGPPRIQRNAPGFKALHQRVRQLERLGKHNEIYALLNQVRAWEVSPRALPPALRLNHQPGSGNLEQDDDSGELIDLSSCDDSAAIDVDT